MATKDSVYRLPKEASLLSNHLTRFRRLLNNRLFGPEPRHAFKEAEYFYSNRELSDFMNCSPSTARRYRHRGLIRSSRHGNCVLTHIPTLLDMVAKDDRLSALFLSRNRPRRPAKPSMIRYRSFSFKGWLYIDVRYRGYKTTIVVQPERCPDQLSVAGLVRDVVLFRNSFQPFKTMGHEKN